MEAKKLGLCFCVSAAAAAIVALINISFEFQHGCAPNPENGFNRSSGDVIIGDDDDDDQDELWMESGVIGTRISLLEDPEEEAGGYTTYQVVDYRQKPVCKGTSPAYRSCLPSKNPYPSRGCKGIYHCRHQDSPPAAP